MAGENKDGHWVPEYSPFWQPGDKVPEKDDETDEDE